MRGWKHDNRARRSLLSGPPPRKVPPVVLLYLLLGLAALVAIALLASLLVRRDRGDEVEKFHRARSMTTAWSKGATTSVQMPSEAGTPDHDAAPGSDGAPGDDDSS